MNANKILISGVVALLIMVMTACTHFISQEESMATQHPVDYKELKRHVTCTECHGADDVVTGTDKTYGTFNHDESFYKNHSYYAYLGNDSLLCTSCHTKSFCTDCHATSTALKPNDKNRDNIEFGFSHGGGDYLFRHRIDGAVDPVSCYKCHGRSNNEVCRQCHK